MFLLNVPHLFIAVKFLSQNTVLAIGVNSTPYGPAPGFDYTPLSIVISSCCEKMDVDLGHREPRSRGP